MFITGIGLWSNSRPFSGWTFRRECKAAQQACLRALSPVLWSRFAVRDERHGSERQERFTRRGFRLL